MAEGLTVSEALREAARRLEPVSDDPRLEAEWLMAHLLGTSRSALLLHHGGDAAHENFADLVLRRSNGELLAHIVGVQDFYGLSLRVTPDVLIPRGDSETLIDAARDALSDSAPSHILDCGTGSGALLLAALSIWPEAMGIGIERSPAALAIARENAKRCAMDGRATMQAGDWGAPGWAEGLGQFDLVLANPPYIGDEDPDLAADVRAHEPGEALFAGADGLDAYRALIPQLPGLLAPGGLAVVEIGMRQTDAVTRIARDSSLCTTLHRDLAARPRALSLRRAPQAKR